MDQSSPVRNFYDLEKEFVVDMAREIAVRTSGTRYSAYGFSRASRVIQTGTEDLTTFTSAVSNSVSPNGATVMESGLSACFKEVKDDVGNVLIVLITDGRDKRPSEARAQATSIKDSGVSIVTVGVGGDNNVDTEFLKDLASGPDFFVQSSSFSDLLGRVLDVVEDACDVVEITPFPSVTTTPTSSATPSATPTATPSASPSVTASPIVSSTSSAPPSASPIPTVSSMPSVSPTAEPSSPESSTPSASPIAEPSSVVSVSQSPSSPITVTSPPPIVTPTPSPSSSGESTADSCAAAYNACDFKISTHDSVPTFSVTGEPERPFTPKIVSRRAEEQLGVLSSGKIVPEFILADGSTQEITTAATPAFGSSHFMAFPIKDINASGIGHQRYYGNQQEVARGKCIRVFFSTCQMLTGPPPCVRTNVYLDKSARWKWCCECTRGSGPNGIGSSAEQTQSKRVERDIFLRFR